MKYALSLNGMKPFGGRPNTKSVQAWPKVDNIISFRTECYIWYQSHSQPQMGESAKPIGVTSEDAGS
jgi:hypothetical protein